MNEFYKDLWIKAQKIAEEKYDRAYGEGSWEDADKYEREDWAFDEYDRLRKERENMCERDPKTGRFVSTKANGNNETTNTTNNNVNVKENDTMMNKTMTKAEERTMKLAQAGVNVDNFFNLTLSVPFGKEVRILVDGKEVTVPTTNNNDDTTNFSGTIGHTCGCIGNWEIGNVNDPIAQSIINDGYVKNSKLFRRWILAKTMNMLSYTDRKDSNRKGWEACMKDCYSYGYVFNMLSKELHRLADLQREDVKCFEEETHFFNGNVVITTLNDYLYRLKKYIKKELRTNSKKYRGEQYCKLARYGNVLVKDLEAKVYTPIKNGIVDVEGAVRSGNYKNIEKTFNDFVVKLYNKLPYETPKCAAWKDAYKGAGGFYSLQNAIRFHKVVLKDCNNKYDSERKLNELLNGEYKNDVWKFHNLLVEAIEYNNFDLRKSIAEGNKADGTVSSKAIKYKK